MRNAALLLITLLSGLHSAAILAATKGSHEVRVLLVGVGEFAPDSVGLDRLEGPVNDLPAMKSILQQRLVGTSTPLFHTLLNQDATREAILTEIREFLGPSPAGSVAILYFSGHGSRVYGVAPHKPDRYDSTLIPYDARVRNEPNRDIHDVELGQALAPLDRKGVHVLVILDSCFSGGATRGTAQRREAPYVTLTNPSEAAGNVGAPPIAIDSGTQKLGSLARFTSSRENIVVFSASEADSLSYESADANQVVMGNFTRALVESLRTGPNLMTYRQLEFEIRSRLGNLEQEQSPHTEGRLERPVFAAGAGRSRLVIEASQVAAERYRIEAGTLVGITEGSEFAAYDTATKAAFGSSPQLARGKVDSVLLGSAELSFVGAHLPKTLFIAETAHQFVGEPLRIFLDESLDLTQRQALTSRDQKTSGFVLVPRDTAEWIVTQKGDRIYATNRAGYALSAEGTDNPLPERQLDFLLHSAARAKFLANLRQSDVAVDVGFQIMVVGSSPDQLQLAERRDGAFVLNTGDDIRVCLRNGRSTTQLHFYLLSVSQNNEVHVLWPPLTQGMDTPLAPGTGIPTDHLNVEKSGSDLLKLIVTDAQIPAYVLEQLNDEGVSRSNPPEHLSALDAFLSEAASGARVAPRLMLKTWATREASVIVRARVATTRVAATQLEPAPPCR